MSLYERIPALANEAGIRWTNPITGVALSLVGAAFAAGASVSFFDAEHSIALTLAITAFLVLGLLWLATCRIPRNKRGHIGIALAIATETEDERKRIRADFIKEIELSLRTGGASMPFFVVEIPGYLAPDVNDTSGAIKFLTKSRCRLLIWGGVRTRRKGKEDVYALRMEGAVSHSPIALDQSQSLANEMRSTIPSKLEISLTNELREFESVSQSIAISAKYVVAIATALSGDLDFSKILLKELSQLIESSNKPKGVRSNGHEQKLIGKLKVSIPKWVAEICAAQVNERISRWHQNKQDFQILNSAEELLNEFVAYHKKYAKIGAEYWIPKAMLEVTLRENFKRADELLQHCAHNANENTVWRLSRAFVKMCTGAPAESLSLYDAAFRMQIPPEAVLQIEDYVQWWLAKHNGPPGLFLLSAMLNLSIKRDHEMALSDLSEFESRVSATTDKSLIARAANLRRRLSTQ